VLMRLKAAQPSAKECQKVAAKVAHWASRLAVIHRQQQEIKDDMLQVRQLYRSYTLWHTCSRACVPQCVEQDLARISCV
jgi:hypothetical protein